MLSFGHTHGHTRPRARGPPRGARERAPRRGGMQAADPAASAAAPDANAAKLRLAVIGAGPHALSLLCRFIGPEPDLMTEEQRVHMMAKAGTRARPHAVHRP